MPLCPKCRFEWKSTIRSNPQNSYYWGVVIELISEHTGFTLDEVHEILKHKFLAKRVFIKSAQEYVDITKSTTILSTVEMEEFLSQIRRWAVIDLGISIPEPNEIPMKAEA